MLQLQAQTLEQQERLYKNQIRLNIREILQTELNFYRNAFSSITQAAAILGGFAMTTFQIIPMSSGPSEFNYVLEGVYYALAVAATAVCLLTVAFSEFTALFSMRLALRGGEHAVEETIQRVRGEYKIALFGLILGIELFLNAVPFLMVWKLSPANATVACLIIYPCVVLVLVLYKRSESKFYLDADDETGTSSKWQKDSGKRKRGAASRGLNITQAIDSRNQDQRVGHFTTASRRNVNAPTSSSSSSSSLSGAQRRGSTGSSSSSGGSSSSRSGSSGSHSASNPMGSHSSTATSKAASASESGTLRGTGFGGRGVERQESFPTKQVPDGASLPALNLAYVTAEKNRLRESKTPPKEEEKKRFWSFTTTASTAATSGPTTSHEDRMETGTL